MIKRVKKLEEVIDFAWELSQDDLHASYARMESMKEVKREIERAIREENYNIVASYHENVLCGVCIYYWICDEKYAQTRAFLLRGDHDQIAEEFISHIRNQLAGYELLIGVPFTNKNANQYFKKKNIECIEASIVTKLYNLEYNINQKINQKHECVEKITESDFAEYAIFHDKYSLGMYYNSKNLRKDMERFRIFVFRQDEAIHGSIFVKIVRDTAEVVGLFVDKEYENKGIGSILINDMLMQLYNEFGAIKEIAYFIEEDCTDELNSVLAAGFEIKDKYRCYRCTL
ncbi:GNAT family N-acetyltransferase [Abyssisolibacter fermentans]|uniref:GNAT family N-acetyltransferase n=1 Tax=Abyssisolibacter fermentans TaxID=1766203 RepID=UPI0008347DFB|nr:GNAT family N-acetyltransferase [Abyssisolibacter fermentans]